MNANENIRANAPDEIIELGVVSTDTHGPGFSGEAVGTPIGVGISEE